MTRDHTRLRLVLASASPARHRLLTDAGIAHEVVVSGVDEDAITAADTASLVQALALAKAAAVAQSLLRPDQQTDQHPAVPSPQGLQPVSQPVSRPVSQPVSWPSGSGRTLVLGCDSLLELDGAGLGKPADVDEARRRWQAMAGRSGVLHTGHALVEPGGATVARTVSTVVRFGRPDSVELEAYLASGEPLAVAGAFTLDGRASAFLDGIEGDAGSVIGLSLSCLRALLAEVGVRVTELWQ